jgi:hypothetical protein
MTGMSEQHFPGFDHVTLRAVVEINGRRCQATTTADVRHWNENPQYQDHMKAETLRGLAEAIVKDLAPEVTVTMPAPTLHEALTEALRPYDYPQEY